jgi:hypothetical protein
MNVFARCVLSFALAMAAVEPATASEDSDVIGYVMKVTGETTISDGIKTVVAAVGTPITHGTILRVGPHSSLGLTLKDNTLMSLGPNSELAIEDYVYAPAKDDLKLTARITHGTLNFVSGVISKLRPENVQIKTPTGTIGVRGTHFLVKVD